MQKARNVVLADALTAKEIPGAAGGAYASEHRIVKVMKPFAPFSQSAAATAPFVLPRIPFKVNQYWTFQAGTGDSPTFPVVAFQLFTMKVYEDFIRLLKKLGPPEAAKLPADSETVISAKAVSKVVRDIKDIFDSDPSLRAQDDRRAGALGLPSSCETKFMAQVACQTLRRFESTIRKLLWTARDNYDNPLSSSTSTRRRDSRRSTRS